MYRPCMCELNVCMIFLRMLAACRVSYTNELLREDVDAEGNRPERNLLRLFVIGS
jgi:hypothetical protein